MAGRGRVPNSALRRYDDLPVAEAIYVMEAGDGTIKIGIAGRSIHSRLRELHTYMVRNGFTPGRFTYFPTDEGIHLNRLEARCLHALGRIATPIPGRREYFRGVDFDTALRIVESNLTARAA